MPNFSSYGWNQLSPANKPSARTGHAMVWDGTRIVLFGGGINGLTLNAETWVYASGNWTQLSPATSPSARTEHAMVWDGTRVLLHGGISSSTIFSDTWEFDGTDWNQLSPTTNPARYRHQLAWDGTRALMYGGFGPPGATLENETWEFDGTDWSQITTTDYPGAIGGSGDGRAGYRMVWDGTKFVFFSGYSLASGDGEFPSRPYYETGGGTWFFESEDWNQPGPATNPSARWRQGMVVTHDDDKVLMFGGRNTFTGSLGYFFSDEMYEFNGTNWTSIVKSNKPTARESEAVWDTVNSRLLIFGGMHRTSSGGSTPMLDETWEFAPTSAPDPIPTEVRVHLNRIRYRSWEDSG